MGAPGIRVQAKHRTQGAEAPPAVSPRIPIINREWSARPPEIHDNVDARPWRERRTPSAPAGPRARKPYHRQRLPSRNDRGHAGRRHRPRRVAKSVMAFMSIADFSALPMTCAPFPDLQIMLSC